VRSVLRRQPTIPAFGRAAQETREWAGNAGVSRVRFCLRTVALQISRRKSVKVSGLVRENSRFAETIGGDWFDQDCRFCTLIRFRAKDSQLSPPPIDNKEFGDGTKYRQHAARPNQPSGKRATRSRPALASYPCALSGRRSVL